jgi:hypothetical protein
MSLHYDLFVLGQLVFTFVAGGGIGLVRWYCLPEATRGHLVWSMLRWSGLLLGVALLRAVFSMAWGQFWYDAQYLGSLSPNPFVFDIGRS